MRISSVTILLILALANLLHAQVTDSTYNNQRPKVGLVLSGGSAHGLAHIGVIQTLEELNIPIDYITGTSMGAIVGACKAMGYDAQRLKNIASQMPWSDILADRLTLDQISPAEKYYHDKFPLELRVSKSGLQLPLGFVNSNTLDLVLANLFAPAYGVGSFSNLPIPFKAITVDIITGKVYVLEEGDLSKSIRSSMAIPSVFPPVMDGDRLYVDGGLIRNFPAQEVVEMGADVVIGSYVGARKYTFEDMNSLVDLMRQAGFLFSLEDYQRQLQYVDVLIKPDIKKFSSMNFDLDNFYIDAGYEAAQQSIDKLKKLRDSLDLDRDYEVIKPLPDVDFIFIKNIEIPGLDKGLRELIEDKLEIDPGTYTSLHLIEEGIRRSLATQSFSTVGYTLKKDTLGANTLIINSNPIRQTTLGVNINRFRSTGSSIILGATLKNYLADLTDFRLTARISNYPGAVFELTRRGGPATKNFVYGLRGRAEKYEFPIYYKNDRLNILDNIELGADAYIMWEYSTSFSMTGYYNYNYHSLNNLFNRRNDLDYYRLRTQSLGFRVDYNSHDDQVVPRRGISFFTNIERIFDIENSYFYQDGYMDDNDLSDVTQSWRIGLGVRQALPFSKRMTLIYQFQAQLQTDQTLTQNFLIGGTIQDKRRRLAFIGQDESHIQVDEFLYSRVELDFEIFKNFHVTGVINHVIGNTPLYTYVDQYNNDPTVRNLGYGLSLRVDLPTGPLQIDMGRASDSSNIKSSLSLGYRHIF